MIDFARFALESGPHEDGHAVYVSTLLLLVMIAVSLNLAHFLHHKGVTFLNESAIFILFGIYH